MVCACHRCTLKPTANTNLKFPAVIRPQWKSTVPACIVLKLLSLIGRLSLSQSFSLFFNHRKLNKAPFDSNF